MNEVEKMYANCKIKKQYCGWLDMGDLDTQYKYVRCDSLEEWKEAALMSRTSYSSEGKDGDKPSIEYPPFTAEKQLELIKWLGKLAGKLEISSNYNDTQYLLYFYLNRKTRDEILPNISTGRSGNFEESLAGLINNLWQDLTDVEKAQIKEILQ